MLSGVVTLNPKPYVSLGVPTLLPQEESAALSRSVTSLQAGRSVFCKEAVRASEMGTAWGWGSSTKDPGMLGVYRSVWV